MLTNNPIIGVITGLNSKTSNKKTGSLLQTWIIAKNIDPINAIRAGEDESVCGDCPARGSFCYVSAAFGGPNAIFRQFRAGKYPRLDISNVIGKDVRCGSYGDPAAIPYDIWVSLLARASGWTAYTHQWRTCDQRYKNFCMASVESEEQMEEARAKGWRTFRTRLGTESLGPKEFVCPASNEFEKSRGKKITCQECKQCDGGVYENNSRRTPVIIAHGLHWKQVHFKRYKDSLNVSTDTANV